MTETIQHTNQLMIYGQAFQGIVDRAVAKHLAYLRALPEGPDFVMAEGAEAAQMINDWNAYRKMIMEGDELVYSRFAPRSRTIPFYTYGLDFRPSHSLSVGAGRALFALNPDTSMVTRSLTPPRAAATLLSRYAVRALDIEEASALVDFAAMPHLDDGSQREMILRVTPEDEAAWSQE